MVKLVSMTKGIEGMSAEELVAFTARVSNPANQMNLETAPKLIAYLIKHKHWSPLEMSSATIEIKTSRAIAAQILRHRSFSFQEFSQRYAKATSFVTYPARSQDHKNKQNSIDDMSEETKEWFAKAQRDVHLNCNSYYQQALDLGIAKEQARFLLPLSTETTLYMSGTLRSWVHYISLRSDVSTQLEHREIAEGCKKIFIENFPTISEALNWVNNV